jgi:hypothetical protein
MPDEKTREGVAEVVIDAAIRAAMVTLPAPKLVQLGGL